MNVNVLLRSLVKTVGMLYFMLGLSWELTLLACVEMPLVAALQNNYNKFSQVKTPAAVHTSENRHHLQFGEFFNNYYLH